MLKSAQGNILNKHLGRVIDKALGEGKQLFGIFIYFCVLIGLFSVFKSLVLNEQNLIYHEGFTIINAWLLAKVVLIAEFFQVADNLRHKPLVYPIVFKSAVFCVILMCFYIIEEMLIGLWHGKTIVESFPEIGGGSWRGILVIWSILFVGHIPFFAYRELSRILGKDELYSLIFKRGTGADVTRPTPRQQGGL